MSDETKTFDVPRPAIMGAALALAESEGMSINQGFLRDAEAAVAAAICRETDGCTFFKGHDGFCSPALIQQTADYEQLRDLVQPLVDMFHGPLADVIKDFLANTAP